MAKERFNEQGLILSENYSETMQSVVIPYLDDHSQERMLKVGDEEWLHCVVYPSAGSKGTVVIVHGFTESTVKFNEIVYSLLQNGYGVCIYDQRGHGLSWRKNQEDMSLTHVDRFQEYVKDLKSVCDAYLAGMPKPWFLLAHSMGGAVVLRYLQEYEHSFSKAVLCAPMIAANRHGVPFFLTKNICRTAKLRKHGDKRVFFSQPYEPGSEKFENSCATGRERFEWYEEFRAAHLAYSNNGPSYSWTLEAMKVSQALLFPGMSQRIRIPVRIYCAENDSSVLPSAQRMFAAAVKTADLIKVPGSKHEIYRSNDDVLFPWWKEVLAFMGEDTRHSES